MGSKVRNSLGNTVFLVLLIPSLGTAQDPPSPLSIAGPDDRALPITLPTALKLAGAEPLDIAVAEQRVAAALAREEKAKLLWLPTLYLGVDYFRHDGQIQDIVGHVFSTSRSSFMAGAGPSAVFALADAYYGPIAARQQRQAREAEAQAVRNNTLLAVAECYFLVQQARGDLAGAADTARRADDLVVRVEKLVPGLAPRVEVSRARAERARRRQAVESAYERWQVASAELARLLRLEATAVVEPAEPPHLRVDLFDVPLPADELIPLALTHRPELAAHQALVQASLTRLKQERLRPLVPSVLIRGNATNPGGTLSGGVFGGGINDDVSQFKARHSLDAQLVWEIQNLGFGNRAIVKERQAEKQEILHALFRLQDRVAAEVVQAQAQSQRASMRCHHAEEELRDALESAALSLEGVGQTKRVGEALTLVLRPAEVVASLVALDQAYRDFHAAIADANRAQFRLYRALGHPADCIPLHFRKAAPAAP